jgi:hypothetical protein
MADPDLDQRIVMVDKSTNFIRLQKIIDKNNQLPSKSSESKTKNNEDQNVQNMSQQFDQIQIPLSDIKVSDHIIAASANDIKNIKNFKAERVVVINEMENAGTGKPAE